MMKNKRYLDEICPFCSDLWGSNKADTCKSPCMCASYANQDFVHQNEQTVGLPKPRSWDQTLVPEGQPDFLNKLTEKGRKRVNQKIGKILEKYKKNSGELTALQDVMFKLLHSYTKEEICDECGIEEDTFYKCVKRLRDDLNHGTRARNN